MVKINPLEVYFAAELASRSTSFNNNSSIFQAVVTITGSHSRCAKPLCSFSNISYILLPKGQSDPESFTTSKLKLKEYLALASLTVV